MKILTYIFKVVGSTVFSIISAYLLWLLFSWFIPYVMSAGWLLFIVYMLIAGGLIGDFIAFAAAIVTIPLMFLTNKNKLARYIMILVYLVLGYSIVMLPYRLNMEFGFLQWLIAIMLNLTAVSIIIILIAGVFHDND